MHWTGNEINNRFPDRQVLVTVLSYRGGTALNQNSDPTDFRTRALAILATRVKDDFMGSSLTDQELKKLIHELQVYQIEFELQNEELRASEELLRKGHERLEDLYEFAPVGYLTVNKKGIILSANHTSTAILGADRQFLLNRPLQRFLSEDDADKFSIRLALLFQTNQKQTLEFRFQKDNGDPFYAQLECVAIPEDDNNAPAAKIIMMDISARKEIEALLARQSALTESMYALSMKFLDTDSMLEITNLTLDEALKLTGSKFGFAGYIDPATGALVCPTLTTNIWDSCKVHDKGVVFETFSGLWGWVLNNRTAVLTNAPHLEPCSSGIPEGHLPIHRFLAVPAMDGARLVGQIAVANSDRDYNEDDLTCLQQLASIFSLGIKKKLAEEAKTKLIADLEKALSEIKTLSGFIPICAACKKIRDDQGYWQAVEVYIRDRTDAQFSHGICPDCARKLYPDYFQNKPTTKTQDNQE